MAKPWKCLIGFHRDERLHAVDGPGYYARCQRCGRERDIPAAKFGG